MTCLLHFIHDPVPVSDGLHRDGAASRQASQECPIRFSIMIDSHCRFLVSCFVHRHKHRIFFVRITTDKMSHAATPPPMVLTDRGIWYPPIGVAALSSNQAGRRGFDPRLPLLKSITYENGQSSV